MIAHTGVRRPASIMSERDPVPNPSSPTSPFSVAFVAQTIQGWIERLGEIWVEGEIIQFNARPGAKMQYLTLRDLDRTESIRLSIWSSVLANAPVQPEIGAHVLVRAKPDFYTGNSSFSLRVSELRPVGIGELLARIEHLKRILAAEGLFDAERKKPLPFLPGVVGLITGRNSDAKHDVVRNAQLRWPAVRFEIHEVAVQGAYAVAEVRGALAVLDAMRTVEVIVIARGGGGLEDLLPFSDEALIRAVAAAQTPVVSAIGHERDNPLLDYVADLRASTPTDAAKRIVPDVTEQRRIISDARRTQHRALRNMLEREQYQLDLLRSRPALADPVSLLDARRAQVISLLTGARHRLATALLTGRGEVSRSAAQVRALSPAATLERGYAVVQRPDGVIVRSPAEAPRGTDLRIRLAEGVLSATSLG